LFALTFFSGAFVVPILAGLLKLKVNKKRVAAAIILGGCIALSGKIIQVFYFDLAGNLIIISTYMIHALLLFTPSKKSGK
jgi:SSS family solute:Na+ symporter